MKKVYFLFCILFCSTGIFSQTLYDSFSDGNYTTAPVWSGTAAWGIVLNSDVAAGAAGSNTLRLAAATVSATEYLSSQISTWGVSQEWGFFMGRRAQALTAANQSYFWLYANEATLVGSATVDGYRLAIGDDSGGDDIRLEYIVNGAVSATLIATSTTPIPNTLTDIGLLIRVTRSATGDWAIFSSTVPVANGNGAVATDIPNVANTTVSQGTATHNTLVPAANGYIGVAALHSTGATAIIGAEFDQVYFTPTVAGTPNIIVAPNTLAGFSSLTSVPSGEQPYTVEGTDLSADIVITPPVGFEISQTTAPFVPENPITLTESGGIVTQKTIYVRMNSATPGLNTGDVTHVSAGSNDPDVSVTGNVLDVEPTAQSSITFGAVTNSTIVVNFTGGNGSSRILVAKALTAVNADPIDGTTYTGNAAFGTGSNLGGGNFVLYTGNLNTVLVTGLTAGTMYHFAIYEYNDGSGTPGSENYLVPGGLGNIATVDVPIVYTWTGLTGGLWTDALNWLPTRDFPATNDILLFLDGTTETVTNVPNQTIGQLHITLGTHVTLEAAATGTALTIGGNAVLDDFTIDATSALNIATANAYSINLGTGATAVIDGGMTFTGTASNHRFTAADPAAITFNAGAVFTAGAGFLGNAFGTTSLGSVIFTNGSRYDYAAGSNPFGALQPQSVVVFQTGSLFRAIGNNPAPAFSGRTYADVEFAGTGIATMTGGAAVSIDNLTVTSGTVNVNMTTGSGHAIKGNISVAGGATLNFNPLIVGTLNLNGTALQTISNAGTISFSANQNVNINNSNGVTLNSPITILGTLNFTNGIVNTTGTNLLTMGVGSVATGASNASFVNGPVSKIGSSPFIFPVGKPNCGPSGTVNGYAAIEISAFAPGAPTDQFTAEYIRGDANALGGIATGVDHISKCDYWTLNKDAGPSTVDITLYWDDPINNCTTSAPYVNNLGTLAVVHSNNPGPWDAMGSTSGIGIPPGATATGYVPWTGAQSGTFGAFAIASTDFHNPLPITINYFTGTKQNSNHLLNWKVNNSNNGSVSMEIQRSSDGRVYTGIYTATATALQCLQPFSYTDNQAAKGVNYYRLKMTDATGKISYSNIVPLINADNGFEVMNIAPNPVVNRSFNLNVSAAQKANMEVVITDMQGRLMQKRSVNMIAGFNSIPMNVSGFAPGTYQVYGVTTEGRSKVMRFVIQ